MTVIAIDPGNVASAFVLIDADRRPLVLGKAPNHEVRAWLSDRANELAADGYAIEMVASYGMAVGADVFDTCVWIGRFAETIDAAAADHCRVDPPCAELVPRPAVKLHHCHSRRANDANITQALVDRFAKGEPNRGKGTKSAPGWFYGFTRDVWQAYALAVCVADRLAGVEP